MTRVSAKPTNRGQQGVTAPVSPHDDRMHPVFAPDRAEPARAAFLGDFAACGR